MDCINPTAEAVAAIYPDMCSDYAGGGLDCGGRVADEVALVAFNVAKINAIYARSGCELGARVACSE